MEISLEEHKVEEIIINAHNFSSKNLFYLLIKNKINKVNKYFNSLTFFQ